MIRLNCVVCGKEFEAERRSAKYDSAACRAQAYRERKRAQRKDADRVVSDDDVELFQLLDAINPGAGEVIMEIQNEHGKPAARRALRVFEMLLEQGLVVRR